MRSLVTTLPCFRCPHFPLQPAARKPPPQEPCQNGALILLPFPVLGGVLGSMVFGGDVGNRRRQRLRRCERFIGSGRWWPSNPSFPLLWLGGTHNLLFCTGLYWHEQRIDGRQAFFCRVENRRKAAYARTGLGEILPSSHQLQLIRYKHVTMVRKHTTKSCGT